MQRRSMAIGTLRRDSSSATCTTSSRAAQQLRDLRILQFFSEAQLVRPCRANAGETPARPPLDFDVFRFGKRSRPKADACASFAQLQSGQPRLPMRVTMLVLPAAAGRAAKRMCSFRCGLGLQRRQQRMLLPDASPMKCRPE